MAVGIFTRRKRVSFVSGWETGGTDPADGSVEVGDGTPYPLEITLDQIAEIYHRVKDAWFIEGNAFAGTGDPYIQPEINTVIYASTTAPANRRYDVNFADFTWRGYTTPTDIGGVVFVDPSNEPYLQAAYDSGLGVDWRDIADNERGIYTEAILPAWSLANGEFTNAFTHRQENFTPSDETVFFTAGIEDSVLPPIIAAACLSSVLFNGYVAVIKADPSHNLVAATNRYFAGMEFQAETAGVLISTNKATISGTVTEMAGGKYVVRLAGDVDIECPIYTDNTGYANVGCRDFVHKAQEWWPYAKTGGAVWDSATGVLL